jgi:hypothetical protein
MLDLYLLSYDAGDDAADGDETGVALDMRAEAKLLPPPVSSPGFPYLPIKDFTVSEVWRDPAEWKFSLSLPVPVFILSTIDFV